MSRLAIQLDTQATRAVVDQVTAILESEPEYEAIKQVTSEFLGSRKLSEQKALFGFWVPGLQNGAIKGKETSIKLELYTAMNPVSFHSLKRQQPVEIRFQHDLIQLEVVDDFMFAVVENGLIGTREQLGTLYWLRYFDAADASYIIRDPLVQSTPFGVYAPAELFDIQGMLAARRDMAYFQTFYKTVFPDGTYRARDVGSCLEIHTETATEEGTLQALTRRYQEIGKKIQSNIDAGAADIYKGLSLADLNFIGFDSIELTPEVPPAEREAVESETGEFFRIIRQDEESVTVQIKRPDISNWGYDTPILGSAAVNPSILETLRPNEFLAFIETLHTMPDKPIQICIDSVLGHCDFQGARLLETFDRVSEDRDNLKYVNSKYLRGPNMYGRDINFSEPHVKAIILELLIRKLNFGFDCVRVDGAQDFILEMDEVTGLRIQDDAFLNEMANVVQDINGLKRRLDFNFEDGRPWPDDLNWLYNSKYLDHTIERTLPFGDRVKQWSPIIFAHNVHGKFKWFMNKWDRFVEVFRYGENWITGHSNHDNARYFYRMTEMIPSTEYRAGDPFDDYYNDQLGETMKDVVHNALDNPALSALMLGFLPGNPLFMLNTLFRTPWLFMRDIDDTYDVKIVGDEGARFFTWYINDALYSQPDMFPRLKALGFSAYRQLVAPPKHKEVEPGFLDVLSELSRAIKTDALMVRFLFEAPDEVGGYPHLNDLKAVYNCIMNPTGENDQNHRSRLEQRLADDTIEAARRVKAARKLLTKNYRFLERDVLTAPDDLKERLISQTKKLEFLKTLDDHQLGLLIEDADYRSEYHVPTWAQNEHLNALAPDSLKEDGRLTASALKAFSRAFMLDARDSAKVHRYADVLNPHQARYNFALRRFRSQNAWLLGNPTNDVQRDYFARKLFINGAKDVGDWGDKGDVVKCNTIYYGWRTSPDSSAQVFLIANMEGHPIDSCPLKLFLNLNGEWDVAVKSPGLEGVPSQVNRDFVLSNFKNGDALLLHRSMP